MKKELDTNKIVGAIILSGALIAFAILISQGSVSDVDTKVERNAPVDDVATSVDASLIAPVTKEDHVRGSTDPLITIYEYSDFECPFCKNFHGTLEGLIDTFGEDVRWVYRHYPIESLHRKAMKEAIASECAFELAGPDGFWFFASRFFELSPSNDRTDLEVVLPQIAGDLGINTEDFLSCIEEERYKEKVQKNAKEAVATGGGGTPWSIIVSYDGSIVIPVRGMFPYESMAPEIERMLKELSS